MEPGLTRTDAPSAEQRRVIGEGLRRYNEELGLLERHGYRAFGTIESGPPGTRRIFMAKTLA